MKYEVECPNCQTVRTIEEDDAYEDFTEVPCLSCGTVNAILILRKEVFYENIEANIASRFRNV